MTAEAAKESAVHFRVTAQGGLTGECYLEFYAQQVAELTVKITKDQPTAAGGEEQTQDQNGDFHEDPFDDDGRVSCVAV